MCIKFVFNEPTVLGKNEITKVSCSQNQFKCHSFHQNDNKPVCLPNHKQCDNRKDCSDGSDEDPKMCRKYLRVLSTNIFLMILIFNDDYCFKTTSNKNKLRIRFSNAVKYTRFIIYSSKLVFIPKPLEKGLHFVLQFVHHIIWY